MSVVKRSRRSAGDTIVEVLIAMAVASAVLGGAYAVTNHTLANSQQAQEHSEALKLAEGQLEHLKSYAEDHSADVFSSVQPVYCFAEDGTFVPFVHSVNFDNQQTAPTPSDYPMSCKDLRSVKYRTGIAYNSSNGVFTVNVDWDGATGGHDHVGLVYKVMKQ